MRTEAEIKARIADLEGMLCDEDTGEYDEEAYLDEGQQSELNILYWVLGEPEGAHLDVHERLGGGGD